MFNWLCICLLFFLFPESTSDQVLKRILYSIGVESGCGMNYCSDQERLVWFDVFEPKLVCNLSFCPSLLGARDYRLVPLCLLRCTFLWYFTCEINDS